MYFSQLSWASNRLVQKQEELSFFFKMKENHRDSLQIALVYLEKECKEC